MTDGVLSFVLVSGSSNAGPADTFASRADIELRLDRTFTEAEATRIDGLLLLATGAIAEACDKDLDWAATYSPVPTMLRILCIEIVTRVLQNPDGLKSGSESLGAYSKSGTYTDGGGAIALTETEERLARRAVYVDTSGSSSSRSMIDRMIDLGESRDVDELPT